MNITFLNGLGSRYKNFNTKIYCSTKNFLREHGNFCLFIMGALLLVVGLGTLQVASAGGGSGSAWNAGIIQAIKGVFNWLDGGFGALIMVGAGLLAIVTAAMGAYKAAMACLVVAAGTFILRAFARLFFAGVMDDVMGVGGAGDMETQDIGY